MKHTPGPWAVCVSGDNRSKGYIRSIASAGIPGATAEDGTRPAIARVCETGHSADVRRANERLLVAGPELLELVREALESLDVNDLDDACRLGLDGWVVEARAVVAKIVGR